MLRQCKVCNESLPLDAFSLNGGPSVKTADGNRSRRHICISCFNLRRKGRRKNEQRAYTIKTYGLTPKTYAEMLVSQNGVCAICGALPEQSIKGVLAVDHDHTTGKVRGLLCGLCNSGIGQLKDNPQLLRKAALYLETQGTK